MRVHRPKPGPSLVDRIADELARHAYRFSDEKELQDGIAQVLRSIEVVYAREHVAGPGDRFDFLVAPGIVIEAKTQGSWSQSLRQVDRYCLRDDVTAVIVATTTLWGRVPTLARDLRLRKKPVRVVHLGGQSF